MPFSMIVAPKALPVTVEEVKSHSVVPATNTIDDKLLEFYIKSATIHGQILTGQQFVSASFELDLDELPSGLIKLLPKLQSVESVVYTDGDGESITLAESEYTVKKTGLRGYIKPVVAWPSVATEIVIAFVAGWPTTGDGEEETPYVSTTPEDIKSWLVVRVAGMYEQREPFILSNGGRFGVASMPKSFVDHILDTRFVPGLGAGI